MNIIDYFCEHRVLTVAPTYRVHVGDVVLDFTGRPHRVTRMADYADMTIIYGVPCDSEGLRELLWFRGVAAVCGAIALLLCAQAALAYFR